MLKYKFADVIKRTFENSLTCLQLKENAKCFCTLPEWKRPIALYCNERKIAKIIMHFCFKFLSAPCIATNTQNEYLFNQVLKSFKFEKIGLPSPSHRKNNTRMCVNRNVNAENEHLHKY